MAPRKPKSKREIENELASALDAISSIHKDSDSIMKNQRIVDFKAMKKSDFDSLSASDKMTAIFRVLKALCREIE